MTDLDLDGRSAETVSSAAMTRRGMLRGVGAVTLGAAAVGTLAACGAGGEPADSGSAAGSAAPAGPLAKVADIPVGGAIAATGADGKPIILSQPTAGNVVAMSAICTHNGCTVAPDGAELKCPCHGSVFRADDGSTVSGPAKEPLASVTVRVENGDVLAG